MAQPQPATGVVARIRAGIASTPPFRWRVLSPDQEASVRRQYRLGVPAATLATMYDCSKRTIWRILERPSAPTHEVKIGMWLSRFEITDLGPVQIEPWRPTEAAD